MVAEFKARRDLIVDGLNAIPGITLPSPVRVVLRLPRHLRHRPDRRRAGRPAPQRGRGLCFGRDGLRAGRAAPPALQLRQLAREHHGGSPPDQGSRRALGAPGRFKEMTAEEVASSEVERLLAAAAADFGRYEILKDLVDECIDLVAGLPPERPSRRLSIQGPHAPGAASVRGDALGYPAAVAPVRGSLRPVGRAHRAAGLRHSRRPERGAPGPPRANRRPALRVPGRRPLRADLGTPAGLATPRRPARPCRDGRPDPVPEGQHRSLRPRHAVRGR